ncbi:hybrid sensor histidine kinase/response regulator [Sediminicoccus rosea]|jgi:two-component system chemotaxis sensor kinase CheA|uniref:histidine kinase n=1 Tax=Sediminicoccus rosea TaxID=1225128 RepID=A0ABZ0PJ17_9PROT|nr:chemotaxis protein CheW [Sediminicoccus rosea]WPB85681.1 chemotaxis protein CheW [Sediminicoccus rosea]
MDDLLADFLTETNEGLASLDAALLQLERNPANGAVLSEIFRIVHTIKGTCGFLGLPRLEGVAHAAENVLGLWREGSLPVTPAGITLILTAADRFKHIVAGLEATGSEPAGDDASLKAALDAAASGEAAAEDVAAEAAIPVAESAPVEASAGAPAEAAPASGNAPQTIRVAVDVLEDLMVLVSELVLTRNQLMQLARVEENTAFSVPLQRLSQITSDLQDGVMKTRMQPIGNAWSKLPRLVRDLSHDLGKRIELEMRGADTELDRQVMELIKDPLTHMVRNSADHGLETPEQRRAAGKKETGRILLNAFHEGGHIVLQIGDDGRGLNTDRIKAKCIAQGLATEAELATMSERDIHRFIFRAGFSTAAEVTSVSGRGVGMDVVKTNIERIGGTVDLTSREHKGTTFSIKIPLTLAIAAALIVEAGGERFAIPQAGVLELVRVGGADGPKVERIKDSAVLRLRGQLLPLVPLKQVLRLDSEAGAETDGFVVVTQVAGQLFGIVVDRVFDTEEIVVKPVAPILRHITMFSGNTILGDGSVIMILDPNGIARASGLGLEGSTESGALEEAAALSRRSERHTALLLFRAGPGAPKAVPLGLVARLENLDAARIERTGDSLVVQYRGTLMPLIPLDHGIMPPETGEQPVLVFGDGDRAMGLMVDEILDVVDVPLEMDAAGLRPGFLGSCVVDGKVTDLLDTGYWLKQGQSDWFEPPVVTGARPRVLVAEDSDFFRNLIVPAIMAAGYDVTTVSNGRDALRLREAGERFDVIVSDIHMPELDGMALARAVREGGAWAELPMIALSGSASPRDVERGREAGFSDYIAKFDRDALLASLQHCLQPMLAR